MILGIFLTALFHLSSKGLFLVHNNFRKVKLYPFLREEQAEETGT